MALSNYIPICDAIVLLLAPLVEVVIHDIKKDSIVYINGKLSARKIGDPSLLNKDGLDSLNQIIYPKINFDGRLVKSISVVLEKQWLLCINCDISIFNRMQSLSQAILQGNMNIQPNALFTNDWQEKLHISINTYLQNQNLSFELLNQANKKNLIKYLFDLGAFHEKNAADYVAKVLSVGRATVFKYLKEWRSK